MWVGISGGRLGAGSQEDKKRGECQRSAIRLTGEVPLDAVGAKQTRLLALEVLEDIVGVGAVDIGLGHDRERDCSGRA